VSRTSLRARMRTDSARFVGFFEGIGFGGFGRSAVSEQISLTAELFSVILHHIRPYISPFLAASI
jgi:hypothetical protein